MLNKEDKEVVKQGKNNKREKRREVAQTEEDFDKIYKQYEAKLIKRLGEKDHAAGPEFEEATYKPWTHSFTLFHWHLIKNLQFPQ